MTHIGFTDKIKRKIYFFAFLFIASVFSLQAQKQPDLYEKADQAWMSHWVDSVFDRLTLDERIGQLFMIVADPGTNTKNTKKILKNIEEQHIGGILFSKGDGLDQAVNTNLYQKNSRIPLLISFDGEWGLSMRLKDTPKFPRNMILGAITDNDWLYRYGEEVGKELKMIGVHINFAPVLDVNCNPNNPVIGTRSFGENPEAVAQKGIAYSEGLESTGIMAVGKHFPGHGDTSEDSHQTLPVVNHDSAHLDSVDLYPFVRFINAGFSGMMTGHLSVPALDGTSGKPTSLSSLIVKDLLQDKMKFNGLTFTDALVMKGAGSGEQSVCVQALLAGNDVLLSPANPEAEFNAVKKAIDDGVLNIKDIEEKCIKILSYKYVAGLSRYKPVDIPKLKKRQNQASAERLASHLNAESITLLKDTDKQIPLRDLKDKKIAILSIGTDETTDFQKTLALYKKADFFNIPLNTGDTKLASIIKKLQAYNVIICGVHSHKSPNYTELKSLALKKEMYFCFFVSPYYLSDFRQNIENSKAVVLAYENTPYAQQAAAEVIMGGLPAKGILPVSIPGVFNAGTGILTKKTRLAYQLPEDVGVSSDKLKKIDSIVKDALVKKAFPGCQVLVAKNGSIIYNKSFGYFDFANTHPVQNTDLYDLASVTKATATLPAVMKLHDQKAFTLDDRLSSFIPELKNNDKEGITIKEALFHESGLTPFIPFYQMAIDKSSYKGALFSSKRSLIYRTEYDLNTYARTDFKFDPELVSAEKKPGFGLQVASHFYLSDTFKDKILSNIAESSSKDKGHYLYSDLNFMLLKEMVENITKTGLDKYLNNEFYARLGADNTMFNPLEHMDTTTIAPTENDEFLRTQILIGFPHDEAAAFMGGVSGNAGLFSNANDLAKLLQLFLNDGLYGGERYFSKETCRLFTQTKSPVSRRGLGFDKPADDGDTGPCGKLTPKSVYGHTGFTGTCFWIDPDNQLIYIFLSNRVYPSRTNRMLTKQDVRSNIQDAIYEAIK